MIWTQCCMLLIYLVIDGACLCQKFSEEYREVSTIDKMCTHHWQEPNNKSHSMSLNAKKHPDRKVLYSKTLQTGYLNNGRLNIISNRLHLFVPTFTLSSEAASGERCRRENNLFLSDLKELKLWALKMYDSSGKLSSGFLNGNVNQFGDFDQCLSVENLSNNIRGKYCLAYFQIKFKNGQTESDEIRQIFDLVQSHHAFRSEMNDPGNRVPRFSNINWAVCIPSSCTHSDVESHLKKFVKRLTNGMNFEIEVRVDEEMCYVKKPFKASQSFVIVSIFLTLVIAVVLISTITDFLNREPTSRTSFYEDLLECFSLKRNFKQLTCTISAPDDINCIHGIRLINALLLLLSHKSMAMFFFPYSNRTYLVETLSKPWTILARIASLYTDSFIMISGTLTAYSFMKTLKSKGTLDIKSEYMNRLIRIFPLLTVTVLMSTFIIPELGSGPLWGLTVNHHSNSCKNTWWKNFLFIHNYFGFENMCLTHTHHLGIDTQLFVISPLLVYILHKWQLTGICFLISLAAISTGLRYQLTVAKNLSYFIYPGITVSQMIDTANFSYIIPSHRITVYIIGLITGYVLQRHGRGYKMKSYTRRICWMVAFSSFYLLISKAMNMSHLGFEYDKYEAASYSALAPIVWCLFLAWIIFASHINYGGMIGRVLSSKYYMIWTRISYAVYLVQFPIFFFNVGRQRYTQEFSIFSLVNIFEYFSVIATSIVLTLLFDMPSSNIRKLLKQRNSKRESNVVKKEADNSVQGYED